MNKKGTYGDVLMDNAIYLILLVVFFVGMMFFVLDQRSGGAVWSDFYAKEIVKVIDSAEPGDYVVLDVHKATEVAKSNGIANFEEIFSFDNIKGEVCVKLSAGRASCYNYFNKVAVTYDDGGKWIYYAEPINRLHFKVIERSN